MTTEINLGNLVIPIIKPQKGTDYYTEAEKQELISIVTNNVNSVIMPQEQTRQENEATRQSNEETRQSQENTRQSNEVSRQTAESARVEAENLRQSNESSRISAEQARVGTFNTQMQAVDTAIAGIHTSQDAYDQNAQNKTEAFNTNATNKMNAYNENASEKIAEYDEHVHDYETELASKVDKVQGKGLSTNDYDNTEKGKVSANTEARHTHSNKSVLDGTTASYTTEKDQKLDGLENYDDTELREDIEQNVTNIDDLEQRVEDAENNQLTNTPTPATSHYLQDSADSRFRKFIPIGRTTQESTTGKNKFSSELELGSIDNSTGLPSSAVNTCLRTKDYISVQPSTTYTIKNNKGYYTFLYFYQEDKTYISYSRNTTDTVTFTTDSNTYFIKLRTASDRNENDITAKYMLNTGSTAEPYEQFTGGEPAPNPNYKMPIKNTGDNVNIFNESQLLEATGWTKNNGVYSGVINDWFQEFKNGFSDLTFNESTQYTIFFKGYTTGGTPRIKIEYSDNSSSTINISETTMTAHLFTIPLGKTISTVKADYGSGGQNTLYLTEFKIEQGTKATPYSPYGCGNVNEKVQNKNLCSFTNQDFTLNGVRYYVQDGILYFDGTSTSETLTNNIAFKNNFAFTLKPGNYKLSRQNANGTQVTIALKKYSDDNNIITLVNAQNNSVTFTLTEETKVYIGFYIYNKTFTNEAFSIQIEQGSTATDYVPHEGQNISFPLAQGQKFYEGSHPDDDEKVHHKIGEVVFDGSNDEDWKYLSESDNTVRIQIPLNNCKAGSKVKCNYFKQANIYNSDIEGCTIISGNFYIRISKDIASTISDLRTWLSSHNMKVQYELAEETTEDFTSEQKTAWEQIKKARTYKNITHISSSDETPANVEMEYVQDTKTYIDNKVTELTNAITSLGGNV